MRFVPGLHREGLVCHYVFRMPQRSICKELVIPYNTWGRVLGDAQLIVENLLTRQGFFERISINSGKPVRLAATIVDLTGLALSLETSLA